MSPHQIPTITVNMDLRCPSCNKKGATQRDDGSAGPCLKCVLRLIRRQGVR